MLIGQSKLKNNLNIFPIGIVSFKYKNVSYANLMKTFRKMSWPTENFGKNH